MALHVEYHLTFTTEIRNDCCTSCIPLTSKVGMRDVAYLSVQIVCGLKNSHLI